MTKSTSTSFPARFCRGAAILAVAAVILCPTKAGAQARSLAGGVGGFKANGSASSASATSQTSTAATAQAAQTAQAAVTANQAQAALAQSVAAFQKLAAQQAVTQQAARSSGAYNLGTAANPINGLSAHGLMPVLSSGTLTATSPTVQVVDLSSNGKNQLNLSSGGTVTLPYGTSGTDAVSINGAGSVTTTSGNVVASAGSLTTSTGGTLAATQGGTISLTAGNATLSMTTAAEITSNVAGSYTLSGTTYNFAASTPQPVSIPAGATVSFSGSSAATVTVAGAATVKLSGAGTLALSSASAAGGGTISTNSGTTQFSGAGTVITSQPAGTRISLSGSGSVDFTGAGTDVLPVILQANPAFTTTGNVLTTTGYSLSNVNWSGVGGLTEASDSLGNVTDIITQTQQTALLYWQSFNIGKNTTLEFDQSAGGASMSNWVAFNRVLDPTTSPAQIFGAIQAPGQVYVIDQNGIVFNRSSQVDTHALVASTLPINTNLVTGGLLNNPNGQYLFSSQPIASVNGSTPYNPNNDTTQLGTTSAPLSNPGAPPVTQANTLPGVASGNIDVEEGAVLYSPGSAVGVGGKIALIAPQVTNSGELSAPDGQIILAAGQQVGFDAHPSTDPSLRGLDVAVGAVTGGETVTNDSTGLIYAPEADVTMTAPAIVQNGIIEGLTSISLNARIDLLAMSGLTPDAGNQSLFDTAGGAVGGTVQLGSNSITEILPDYADTSTEVGTSLALPSQVYVEGASFYMGKSADLIAPNATVTFGIGILNTPIVNSGKGPASTAGETTNPLPEDTGVTGVLTSAQPYEQAFYLLSAGSVTLDSSADLDVSGSSNVQASVAENIVSAELTASVLENSPLQRNSSLHGQTVTVDITQTGTNADGSTWFGSPIGDLSGYANLIDHTVGELTIAGGALSINTTGSVNLGQGSRVNVSGGSIDYQGAEVATTYLVNAEGQIVNIANANPNIVYTGIYSGFTESSPKWGVSQTFSPTLQSGLFYDSGYVEGGAGGSLNISAPSVSLQGGLYGNTTQGIRQQSTPPTPSAFNLTYQSAVSSGANPPVVNVVIQPSSDPASADPNTLDLSQDLFGADGFSNATISTGSGKITVASDAVIATPAGGSLSLKGANLEVDGEILMPSGTISLTALSQPLFNGDGTYDSSIGNLTVSSGGVIATTGLTFDELSGTAAGMLPFSVNGGKVNIKGAVTTLASGSSIDASGGLARSAGGTLYKGKGGGISITGVYNDASGGINGKLVLDGSLSAYGIGQGGSSTESLTITAPAVIVTDGTSTGSAQAFPLNPTATLIPAGFFNQGGFSNISVVGSDGVQIIGTVAPVLTEEIANTTSGQFGTSLVSSAQLPAYPAAPVNLTFSAPGNPILVGTYATLFMGVNSSITVGPTGTVSLSGQYVNIQGDVTAPGGNIPINATLTGLPGAPEVTLYLGPRAALSVSGELITAPTVYNNQVYTTGQVLSGGTITLSGNIVGDASATMTADGAGGILDVPYSTTGASLNSSTVQQLISPYVAEPEVSNGGSISINGIEEAYYAGSVSAKPGAYGSAVGTGGILTFDSGLVPYIPNPPKIPAPPNAGFAEVFIKPNGTFSTGPVTVGAALPLGSPTGGGYFTVDQFNAGGFGSLVLNGNVEFEGFPAKITPTTPSYDYLQASQEVEIFPDSLNGTIFADGTNETLSINAPYISIGAQSLNFNGFAATADAPSYVAFTTTGNKNLPASPVPGLADPTYGGGAVLSLNATNLIDVGFLSLQKFGTANLSVPTGDIRGGGLFYAAGAITMTAGQIYTPTAATFTVAAFGSDNSINGGTIDIEPGVARPLPYSAGGTLNFYATTIIQDGNLEAPFGVINLGALADPSTGLTPVLAGVDFVQVSNSATYVASPDLNQYAPLTGTLTLGPDSITSVSGVSGTQVLDLPYGTIANGGEWIAPSGKDITAGGLIAKAINLDAAKIDDQSGAVINLTGGGGLFAYEFNPGVNGTNDILSIYKYANGQVVQTSSNVPVNSTNFAIVPTYGLNYSAIDQTIDTTGAYPYAASSGGLASQVGEEIYLAGGDGIAAGDYAILPARYALLPGGYLVTPESLTPSQAAKNPDGSINMAGYVFNSLNADQQIVPNFSGFQLDSNTVVNNAAPYATESATTFLAASALANSKAVPRLPVDAGQLVFEATSSLGINGTVDGTAGSGGVGSNVDISSTEDIYILSTPSSTLPTGVDSASVLTLSAQELSAIGADSLLIGGTRSAAPASASGTTTTLINPLTDNIYVQNDSDHPLRGNEIILASNGTITLAANSDIEQSGVVSAGDANLSIGNASVAGSGDGSLVRVSGDVGATFSRLGVNTTDAAPTLTIGAGASISGVAVTLDSSSGATIDPNAQLDVNSNVKAQALALSSGTISLQVDPSVSVTGATGLVLGSSQLQSLESLIQDLSLSSYSSINLYGAGNIGAVNNGKAVIQNLTLQATGILGETAGASVTINAGNVTLASPGNLPASGSAPSSSGAGTLAIVADTINFGGNNLALDGFANVNLNANNGMLVRGTGTLEAQGALTLAATEITGDTGANYTFDALGGALQLNQPAAPGNLGVADGLGASVTFEGSNVTLGSKVYAPSGTITAVASTGNVEVTATGTLDVCGQAVAFNSALAYSNGGSVNLTSPNGAVLVDAGGALINVSAAAGGGSAGTVNISAPTGSVTVADKSLSGSAGAGGAGGVFNAIVGQAPTLSGLTKPVADGGFQSMNFDVMTGSTKVDGAVSPGLDSSISSFTVTAENGSITVDNMINASGPTGGTINLFSDQGVTLTGNAVLNVTGQQLNDAGQGGSIDIETRGDTTASGTIGAINIETGAQLLLGVGTGTALTPAGSVHLRAPLLTDVLGANGSALLPIVQASGGNDTAAGGIAIDSLPVGAINNAGSVVIEGYRIYQPTGGSIDSIESSVASDVSNFPTSKLATQLGVGGNALYQIQPGIEIVNPSAAVAGGDLTLASDWDLSGLRTSAGFPGILSIRAANNLIFDGSLTDGFAYNSSAADASEEVSSSPYTWDAMTGESWSYRLVAGASFSISGASPANYGEEQSLSALGLDNSSLFDASLQPTGSLLLGQLIPAGFQYGTLTATTAGPYGQLIRTGTGDITIDAGGSVDLMNQLATIYTAGQVAPSLSNFDLPTGTSDSKYESHVYGIAISPAPQQTAQYTENGGNVALDAGQDIVHLTENANGQLVLDTSWQFPTNWLYRRGATSSTDVFDTTKFKNSTEIASTTWWVDFSNFFEGIGALGGGNVSLKAGGNIVNVDAVVPTNARMPFNSDTSSSLVELGGGDLSVIAAGTIEGGTYYVEKGTGLIQAGTIETGTETGADDSVRISAYDVYQGLNTPLPLTLFVGDSSFTVAATNDVTIGSTVNPFLLPQGFGNGFGDKSVFNTYGENSSVSVSSLLGSITIQGSDFQNSPIAGSLADAYFSNASPGGLSRGLTSVQSLTAEPWTLTLDPTSADTLGDDNVGTYSSFYNFSAPIFNATAFTKSIDYLSDQTLAPSPHGTMQLLAGTSIEGAFNSSVGNGLAATITILDDDPSQLPTVLNPFGLGQSTVEANNAALNPSIGAYITNVYNLIGETPSYQNDTYSTLQIQHTPGLLHDNSSTSPVEIATIQGNIDDFTLIAPEKVDISSGQDLQDVSFYIQNNNSNDVSIISANRNITLFDPNSSGLLALNQADSSYETFGDIQLSGPGTLEVLAGGNLDLGQGKGAGGLGLSDVNLGITTIGYARDPYLPFGGASVIMAAGLGPTSGLNSSGLVDYKGFITNYLNPAAVPSSTYLPELGSLMDLSGATDDQIWDIYNGAANLTVDPTLTTSQLELKASLTPESRDALATTIFYDVLRDAGRNYNNPASSSRGSYAPGYEAIQTLFPDSGNHAGNISLTSREIKTTSGGDIGMLLPGGEVDVGLNNNGTQAVDQGILTVDGGNISIFANGSVNVGTSRIFTLHGGNIIMWSSTGDIDAGAASRTVQSAPPTRVLVDSQSANVETDLAGLATGGGIGVLETIVGAPPGNVDLIAPVGTVNAGDAGIRASGNINIAAAQVLNAGNIQAGGAKTGVPSATTTNIAAAVAGSSAAGSSQNAASQSGNQQQPGGNSAGQDLPSIISVEVLGYGGDDESASNDTPSDWKHSGATYLAERPAAAGPKY